MANEEKSGSYLKYGLCGLLSVTLVATPILLGVVFTDFPTEEPGTLLSNCRKFGDLIIIIYHIVLYTSIFAKFQISYFATRERV